MRLGFGCVSLGSAGRGGTVRTDIALVREAIDLGVTVFDTADVYGAGASERVLGRALGRHRDEVVIATKGGYLFRERSAVEQRARRAVAPLRHRLPGHRSGLGGSAGGGHGYDAHDVSPAHLRTAVEASLRRLRTDHIDVYQVHGPRTMHPGLFDELADLRQAGKVGAFGVGAESVTAAREWLAVPGLSMVQLPFGVLDPEAADVLASGRRGGVEVWARGVLGGGLIERVQRDPSALADDPKAPVLAALQKLAARTGRPMDELAVIFIRSFPAVSTVLFGISSSDHLRRDIELMDAPSADEHLMATINAVATKARDGRS